MTSEAELQGKSSSSPETVKVENQDNLITNSNEIFVAPESSNREASHLNHCQAVIEDQTYLQGSTHSIKHLSNSNKIN